MGLDNLSNKIVVVDWLLVDGRGVPSNLRITKHKSDLTDRGSGALEGLANSTVDLGNKSYKVKGGNMCAGRTTMCLKLMMKSGLALLPVKSFYKRTTKPNSLSRDVRYGTYQYKDK